MTLKARLAERIRAEGPLTFADFMEHALYDAEDGFFSRAPVGRDFVTSAHVSPLFGMLLSRQIFETGLDLVVDVGAGDGTLARQIRAALPDGKVICLDRSAAAREALADTGFTVAETIGEIAPIEGVVIANELFDNVPFHLMRRRGAEVTEVFVGFEKGRFVELESEPTIEPPPIESEEYPASPNAARIMADLVASLRRGYIVVIDYGFVAGEDLEPVRGYRANRPVADLLEEPGSSDITGPVDFDALAAAARGAGATVWGPVSQRQALETLGFHETVAALRDQQHQDEATGDWRSAIASFSARGEASMLIDPSGLGSLKVLVVGTEDMPEPRLVGTVD